MLIAFSGLPGTGKSTLARELARRLDAVWLRIDSIEQAIRDSGIAPGPIEDAGYRAACAVAEDNLRLGRIVIADCVNPWMLTRNAWRDIALRTDIPMLEIETICRDQAEHRRRVETRASDIPGLVPPDWIDVTQRDYHPWDRDHLVIDTSVHPLAACVERAVAAVENVRTS
jgi:predicted kinase